MQGALEKDEAIDIYFTGGVPIYRITTSSSSTAIRRKIIALPHFHDFRLKRPRGGIW